MKTAQRIFMIAALFLAIPGLSFAGYISGVYTCKGTNPDGKSQYAGSVMIRPAGEQYLFTWNIAGKTFTGVGFSEGDLLSVGYSAADKSWFGVIVYRIHEEGDLLKGKWTVYTDNPGFGTETLIKAE